MSLLADLPQGLSIRAACEALGVSRATLNRALSAPANGEGSSRSRPPMPSSARQLSERERNEVIALLHSDRFADQPPREVFAALLSEGRYICSIRTMYRLLKSLGECHERRAQRNRASYEAPFVRATKPNEVWVWDITALPGRKRGEFFYLYAVMDLYSRFIVAWHVAQTQCAQTAERLFMQASANYDIAPEALCVHSDRGAPMTSYRLTRLFEQLGVAPSFSRPRVSDDNPHIESQFKTMKYQPDFPDRFDSLNDAKTWCQHYHDWYNHQHHHAGIALYTPATLFFGKVEEIWHKRQSALDKAYETNPERFVNGRPMAERPPQSTEINTADLFSPSEAKTAPPSPAHQSRLPNGRGRSLPQQPLLPIF